MLLTMLPRQFHTYYFYSTPLTRSGFIFINGSFKGLPTLDGPQPSLASFVCPLFFVLADLTLPELGHNFTILISDGIQAEPQPVFAVITPLNFHPLIVKRFHLAFTLLTANQALVTAGVSTQKICVFTTVNGEQEHTITVLVVARHWDVIAPSLRFVDSLQQ